MKKLIIENTKIIVIATILSVAVGIASAWTAPASLAPAGNVGAPLNTSADGQIKKGNLIIEGLNASNLPYANGLIIENGNVGIGTTTPTRKLEVNGDVRINGSIEYKKNLGKPIVRSAGFSNNTNNNNPVNVLTVVPTGTNLLTINNIKFNSQGGGSYTIYYRINGVESSITNTVSTNGKIDVKFPDSEYQGSVYKVEFTANVYSCSSSGSWGGITCYINSDATFSGYETKP